MTSKELTIKTSEKNNVKVVKTEKYWVHTNHGKLLDLSMGCSAFIFGFDNPYILEKMHNFQKKISYINAKKNESCEESNLLIEKLCGIGGYDGLGWAVSGSDGIECAIYMNDTYYKVLGKNKHKIISFSPGYHGATYLARAMRNEVTLDRFVVLNPPQYSSVLDQLEQETRLLIHIKDLLENDNEIGALIFESIPWIAGICPWTSSFWPSLRNLCDQYDINLILDDVFGSVGKIGPYLSQDRFNVKADIVVIGKAFTGGFSPLSCCMTTKKISTVIENNHFYNHTWHPNMAGVGAALAVLDLFDEKQVYAVEKRLISLGDRLISKGLIPNYVCQGLTFGSNYVKKPKDWDKFVNNGLSCMADIADSFGFVAPIIADDEYFEELEKRLCKVLEV
jgi:adenosylmethionine-8-amino-7-oxononanoate aminotransferase